MLNNKKWIAVVKTNWVSNTALGNVLETFEKFT